MIPLVGSWMQIMVLACHVQQTTGSEICVGVVMALPFLISVALSLPGGAIADYFDKRKLLGVTQGLGMLQAFALGALALMGFMPYWLIIALTAILGVVTAVEIPIRQSFYSDFLEEKDIPVAASLNTTLSTLSLVAGPGLGGILMSCIGVGWTFILNGVSFLAVVVTLIMMRYKPVKRASESIQKMFVEGIRYTWGHSKISFCILLGGVAMMFGFSSRSIIPAMPEKVFRYGADAAPLIAGCLMAVVGFGAFVGSLFISAQVKKEAAFKGYILGGMILTGSTVVALSGVSDIRLAYILFFLSGIGMTLMISRSRAELMALTAKEMRGRVASITMVIFLLGMGLGNHLAAWVAEKVSIGVSLFASGLGLLLICVVFFFAIERIYAPKSHLADVARKTIT